MKKVISMLALFVIAFSFSSLAQIKSNTADPSAIHIELKNVYVTSIKINEGANSVPVPEVGGTIKFTSRGSSIMNVSYTDVAGKTTRLQPGNGATAGGQQPKCKCPLPDACFGSADKSIVMCMCKPCDLSAGEGVSISMLLPWVPGVREAATRRQ